MLETLALGSAPVAPEQVECVARHGATVLLESGARNRIVRGREVLETLLARGERVYGVNTGVGGNIGFSLTAEQVDQFQLNLMNHLSCASGAPLPSDVVRAAMLLRAVTFSTGASAVRPELVDALLELLNRGVIPVVPRYGSVGASGDLMPSAYIARTLIGMGEVIYQGKRMTALEGLKAAGLEPIRFAPKEGLALINGTTVMTGAASLLWADAWRVFHAVLAAIALTIEAFEAPSEPFEPWVQQAKGHPGQAAVGAFVMGLLRGSKAVAESRMQSCYSLRCPPQGLGPVWEALDSARAVLEREINSANDNPLVDIESCKLYLTGNFYGGHIARLLDGWKIDFAIQATWLHALMAILVDSRFNRGLPANLAKEPGLNSGLKGMQLAVTSLTCAIRQMAGPSSIHALPTEQFNQDVVSLGMHSAVTAMEALECLRNETAMVLLAAAQAIDLRPCADRLGEGSRQIYSRIRGVSPFMERDRPMENDVALVASRIAAGELHA